MKKVIYIFILLIIFSGLFTFLAITICFKENTINNIYIDDNDKIVIKLDRKDITFCSLDNKKWYKSKDYECILDYTDNNKNIYLKNKFSYITKIDNKYNLSSIKEFKVTNNKIYLAINGKEKIDYYLNSIVDKDDNVSFISLDNNIATVDKYGYVTGINSGKTIVVVSVENYSFEINVYVTNLIVDLPIDYNYKKQYISCNEFTKEENDLVDEILFNRIDKVGYQTRAAVVEAARFMTLEFSRRIPYFAENGRLSMNNIDGEGRYYKRGLFLNESRYQSLGKKMHGPGTWGCNMYSYPVNRVIPNGLDCSGFVSWAFINAGFDVGDIGAGITPVQDFTDLGIKINIRESINNNSIIVGDLLSGKFSGGGHIAIVMGIKDGYYYIAESLYEDSHKYYGVVARKYSFDELSNYFSWHIDMNDFYENDGLLTDYWLN